MGTLSLTCSLPCGSSKNACYCQEDVEGLLGERAARAGGAGSVVCGGEERRPADVKASYGSASILKDSRVVFIICGNKDRLVAWINIAN